MNEGHIEIMKGNPLFTLLKKASLASDIRFSIPVAKLSLVYE